MNYEASFLNVLIDIFEEWWGMIRYIFYGVFLGEDA